MHRLNNAHNLPDFLVKSTLGIALVSILIVTPFAIKEIAIGHYPLGICILTLTILCIINAYLCYQGHYHLGLNLFVISPVIIIAIAFALYQLGVIASFWPYLGILGFYFMLPEKPAWVVNIIFILTVSPVAWNVLEPSVALRFTAVLLGISFFAFLSMREIFKQHHMLKQLSTTDPLTSLNNRLFLKSSLDHAINQSARSKIPMSLIMLDVDHFKKINDVHGHNVGDEVLVSLGKLLQNFFRKDDTIFRIGGEEFLILMHNTNGAQSQGIAEKLRKKIERTTLIPDHSITASIGVCGLQAEMNRKSWMKQCDENLYQAKTNGRNQVVASSI